MKAIRLIAIAAGLHPSVSVPKRSGTPSTFHMLIALLVGLAGNLGVAGIMLGTAFLTFIVAAQGMATGSARQLTDALDAIRPSGRGG